MLQKTKSKQDPQANFFKELGKEFNPQITIVVTRIKGLFEKYPKQFIMGMICIVILSALLSFFILIPMEKQRLREQMQASEKVLIKENTKKQIPATQPGNNINDIISATTKLKVGIAIKQEVDAILSQPTLNHQDSLRLDVLLDSLKRNSLDSFK